MEYTPSNSAERKAYHDGYHDYHGGISWKLSKYTGFLYTVWLQGWDAAQQGLQLYMFETGQLYALGHSSATDDSTLEIEIGNVCEHGPRARVTFYVYELSPDMPRTAQGSATVPTSWLAHTLTAHRAYLLTECAGHAPVY